jgi:high-affinity K+ transport system ATPase subunit B
MNTTSKSTLQQALSTLLAIRQRYATGHEAHPGARFYSVQVALGSGDMLWLTVAIDALEQAIADGTSEALAPAAQACPGTRTDANATHLRRAGDGQP